MSEPWWRGRLCGLDFETNAPHPEEARIVTAALVFCGAGEPTVTRTWLADAGGAEIPEGAEAVHGISTERARAEGRPAAEVVAEVMAALAERPPGTPVVIQNARYDLTVLHREATRYGLDPDAWLPGPIVDPLIIEKWLDRFRRTKHSGSRKLAGMAEHYARRWAASTGRPVPSVLTDAHDAAADAIAACRIAWLIASMPAEDAVVREPRTWGGHYAADLAERRAMVKEWAAVKDDVAALHAWTAREADAERQRFAAYKRSKGDHETAARVEAERGWPVLEVMAHERLAA